MKHTISLQDEKFWIGLLKDVFCEFSEETIDDVQVGRILKPVLEKIRNGKLNFQNEKVSVESDYAQCVEVHDEVSTDTVVIEIVSLFLWEAGESDFSIEIAIADGQDADTTLLCGNVLNGKVVLGERTFVEARLILTEAESSMIIGTAKTDIDGTFSIGFIGEGKYTLIVVPLPEE